MEEMGFAKNQLKEDFQKRSSSNIANILKTVIEEYCEKNNCPSDAVWKNKSSDLTGLEKNIIRLYGHSKANEELLYFLNKLVDTYASGADFLIFY